MGLGGVAAGIGAAASAASAINGMTSGNSNAGQYGQQAADYRQQAANLWNSLGLPDLSTTPYSGQTWLADYNPETYDPWIGQAYLPSDSPQMRAAEAQTLSQLQGLSQPGLQPSDLAQLGQIERSQAGAASSNYQTAADALRARGLGGSGADLAVRLAADQNAADSASNLYNTALQTALQRQLSATNSAGTLAGNIRNQDTSLSQAMAAVNNQFNTEVQNLRTNAAANAANVRNQAQLYNEQGQQNVANNNVAINNQNLDRQNNLAEQHFQNEQSKISGQSNALNGQASLALAQQAAAAQQNYGANQQMMAGINGLINSSKALNGNTSTNTGTGSTDWMTGLGNLMNGYGWNGMASGSTLNNLTNQANTNISNGFAY